MDQISQMPRLIRVLTGHNCHIGVIVTVCLVSCCIYFWVSLSFALYKYFIEFYTKYVLSITHVFYTCMFVHVCV